MSGIAAIYINEGKKPCLRSNNYGLLLQRSKHYCTSKDTSVKVPGEILYIDDAEYLDRYNIGEETDAVGIMLSATWEQLHGRRL